MSKRAERAHNPQREQLKEMVKSIGITDAGELYVAIRDLFADTLEEMLQAELDEHLGYE